MLCGAVAVTGTLMRTIGRREASPSPVYGAALLMRLGFAPFRGSNPRASASHGPLPGRLGEGARSVTGPMVAVAPYP